MNEEVPTEPTAPTVQQRLDILFGVAYGARMLANGRGLTGAEHHQLAQHGGVISMALKDREKLNGEVAELQGRLLAAENERDRLINEVKELRGKLCMDVAKEWAEDLRGVGAKEETKNVRSCHTQ